MFGAFSLPTIVVVVLVVMFLASAIRVLNEYERAVVFRLGRSSGRQRPRPDHYHSRN